MSAKRAFSPAFQSTILLTFFELTKFFLKIGQKTINKPSLDSGSAQARQGPLAGKTSQPLVPSGRGGRTRLVDA